MALWGDHSVTGAQSYLTDASGNTVYNGTFNIGGKAYKVSGLNPGITNELHLMNAVWLQNKGQAALKWKLAFSAYDYLKEHGLSASNWGNSLAGSDQDQHNTGWMTGDAQATWKPTMLADHEFSFGYHYDKLRLRQRTYGLSQWNTYADDLGQTGGSNGETSTQALYLQDRWQVLPKWVLTLGGRQEWWRAMDGLNYSSTSTPKTALYPNVSRSYFSPKAALGFDVTDTLNSRFSFGRAVRFPTVAELYQQVTQGTTLLTNNPNLLPEDVWSYDWTTEWRPGGGNSLRLTLFREVRGNALISQTDTTVSPNITRVENITTVHMRGVETAATLRNLVGVHGLDLEGSVTYADSQILADVQNASLVGKEFARIPHWRGRAVLSWRPDDHWSTSLGYRYSSGAFSTVNNADINHGVYGGISAYSVFDAKVTYRMANGISLSAGFDNITNDKYFVSPHPYPQATGFLSIKFDR